MMRLIRSFMVFAEQLAVLDEVAMAARRLVTHACLTMMVAFLLLASSACAATSLWLWADTRFGPVWAPLLVAGVLAAGAILILAAMALSRRASRKSRSARASRAVQDLAQAPSRLLSMAAEGFLNGLANGTHPRPKST